MFFAILKTAFGDYDEVHDADTHASITFINKTLFWILIGYVIFLVLSTILFWAAGCYYKGGIAAPTICTNAWLGPIAKATELSPFLHLTLIVFGIPLWALGAITSGVAGCVCEHRVIEKEGRPRWHLLKDLSCWNVIIAVSVIITIIVLLTLT